MFNLKHDTKSRIPSGINSCRHQLMSSLRRPTAANTTPHNSDHHRSPQPKMHTPHLHQHISRPRGTPHVTDTPRIGRARSTWPASFLRHHRQSATKRPQQQPAGAPAPHPDGTSGRQQAHQGRHAAAASHRRKAQHNHSTPPSVWKDATGRGDPIGLAIRTAAADPRPCIEPAPAAPHHAQHPPHHGLTSAPLVPPTTLQTPSTKASATEAST